jgi:hypothetical protein
MKSVTNWILYLHEFFRIFNTFSNYFSVAKNRFEPLKEFLYFFPRGPHGSGRVGLPLLQLAEQGGCFSGRARRVRSRSGRRPSHHCLPLASPAQIAALAAGRARSRCTDLDRLHERRQSRSKHRRPSPVSSRTGPNRSSAPPRAEVAACSRQSAPPSTPPREALP